MQLLWALEESLHLFLSFLGGHTLFDEIYHGMKFEYYAPNTEATQNSSFGGVAGEKNISFFNNPEKISIAHTTLGIDDVYVNLVMVFAHELAHFVVNPAGANPLPSQGLPGVYEAFVENSGWWGSISPTFDHPNGLITTRLATPYALLTAGSNPIAEDAAETLAVSLVIGPRFLHPNTPNIFSIVTPIIFSNR